MRPQTALADAHQVNPKGRLSATDFTGRLDAFALAATVIHLDIDATSINKLAVCVSGDAAIVMNLLELATARQHAPAPAPVKVVLCNTAHMGMVRQRQGLVHGKNRSRKVDGAPGL